MQGSMEQQPLPQGPPQPQPQPPTLCASCDSCRLRKTKCDGAQPCSNCVTRFMKAYKLTSLDQSQYDAAVFNCTYSPAKRRGPIPGRSAQSLQNLQSYSSTGSSTSSGLYHPQEQLQHQLQQPAFGNFALGGVEGTGPDQWRGGGGGGQSEGLNLYQSGVSGGGTTTGNQPYDFRTGGGGTSNAEWQLQPSMAFQSQQSPQPSYFPAVGGIAGGGSIGGPMLPAQNFGAFSNVATNFPNNAFQGQQVTIQHRLNTLEQEIQQQHAQIQQRTELEAMYGSAQQPYQSPPSQLLPTPLQSLPSEPTLAFTATHAAAPPMSGLDVPTTMSTTMTDTMTDEQASGAHDVMPSTGLPRTVQTHVHLLDSNNSVGLTLRAYYKLSIDEMFRLPCTPSNDEYLTRLGCSDQTSSEVQGYLLTTLTATRFAECALGAIVYNEIALAMELCNAAVHCLREVVSHDPLLDARITFDVAKTYFLIGIFQVYRGDMTRYFKYRSVGLDYLAKVEENNAGSMCLLAAISYADSWMYMMYNGQKDKVPIALERDEPGSTEGSSGPATIQSIATDSKHAYWMQGHNDSGTNSIVFAREQAPSYARSLDGIACAIRSGCDDANRARGIAAQVPQPFLNSPSNMNTMVSSAHSLLQQHESASSQLQSQLTPPPHSYEERSVGLRLVISVMDVVAQTATQTFLYGRDNDMENNDSDDDSDLSLSNDDSVIQSLLAVCNSAVENPLVLHHAGPTYHLVSNAALLLGHVVNGLHDKVTTMSNVTSSLKDYGTSDIAAAATTRLLEEALDTFMAIRKLLTFHRRRLPEAVRCHVIPRPNLMGGASVSTSDTGGYGTDGDTAPVIPTAAPNASADANPAPSGAREEETGALPPPPPSPPSLEQDQGARRKRLIDMSDVQLCSCHFCQGFVRGSKRLKTSPEPTDQSLSSSPTTFTAALAVPSADAATATETEARDSAKATMDDPLLL